MTSARAGAAWPHSDGGMAGLIRAHDWAATPLGPITDWPERLKVVVELVLASPHVGSVAVGPERRLLYNDAAARLYDDRHPGALGHPIAQTWPEAYAVAAPLYERVFEGETVHLSAQPLDVSRAGGEVFDVMLLPVRGGDGTVIAVQMIGSEVGARERAEAALREREARQAFLLRFSDALRAATDAHTVAKGALQMIADELRLDRCYVGRYRLAEDRGEFPYQVGNDSVPPMPPSVRLSEFPEALKVALDQTLVIDDVADAKGLTHTDKGNLTSLGLRALVAASLRQGDRHPIWSIVAVSADPRRWKAGEVALIEEVTERTWAAMERAQTAAALAESEQRFRNMADHSPAIMWLTDPDGRNAYLNARWFELTGQTEADLADYGWLKAIHPEDRPACERLFVEAQERKVPFQAEFRVALREGGWRWLLDAAAPRWDRSGSFRGFVGSMIDITDRKVAEQSLARERTAAQHAARHDSLTGLLSRAALRAELDRTLASSSRAGTSALLLVDLDEFKSINDAFGHPVGDALLCEVARRLRTCVRQDDLLARFGGDEFVVLLRRHPGAVEVEALARRLIERLREPVTIEGQELLIGASIGVALADKAGLTSEVLLKHADIALYRAKAAGRGSTCLFGDPFEEEARERLRMRSELRDAAQRGEMRLHFQPVLDLDRDQVVSAEALLRWQHPRRGLLGRDHFVPVAEETGEIEALGAWVLEEACRTATTWPEDIGVSVNLSPRQFRGGHLVGTVRQALARTGLDPSRLQVEITESVLLDNSEAVLAALADLRSDGLKVAIDDFGSGYSSLGYLVRLTVDTVKIDRGLVVLLVDDPRPQAIVRAVIGLAYELGLALIAEGVEEPAQADQLRAMGCHLIQGFLFSPPVPPDRLAAMIASKRAADGGWTSGGEAGMA